MPTIGNMPDADLPVTFASGEVKNVNMIVLLSEVLMAEQMAKFGVCQARNMPTIEALNQKYELEYFFDGPIRTWVDCAAVMRHFHKVCTKHIEKSKLRKRFAMAQAVKSADGYTGIVVGFSPGDDPDHVRIRWSNGITNWWDTDDPSIEPLPLTDEQAEAILRAIDAQT